MQLNGSTLHHQAGQNVAAGDLWNLLNELPARLQRADELALQLRKVLLVLNAIDVYLTGLHAALELVPAVVVLSQSPPGLAAVPLVLKEVSGEEATADGQRILPLSRSRLRFSMFCL